MALTHKRLAKSQIAITAQSVGAPAAGYEWHIKQIILFDNGTNNEVTLYITGTDDDDKIYNVTLTAGQETIISFDYPVILSPTEPLYAIADAADEVNIMVFGAEKAI